MGAAAAALISAWLCSGEPQPRGLVNPEKMQHMSPILDQIPQHGVARWGNFNDTISYAFQYDAKSNLTPAVTIETLPGAGPLGVVFAQPCHMTAFSVPADGLEHIQGNCKGHRVVRQICPNLGCADLGSMSVVLSALTKEPVNYTVSMKPVPSSLHIGRPQTIEVASWMPRFLQIQLHGFEAADLLITSNDTQQALVSLQNASCPVYDQPQNVMYGGKTQTISSQGQLYVRPVDSDSPVFVVIVLQPTQSDCDANVSRVSTFTLHLSPSLRTTDYVVPIMKLLSFYLCAYSLFLIYAVARKLGWRRRKGRRQSTSTIALAISERDDVPLGQKRRPSQAGFLSNHRTKWDDGSYTQADKFYFRSKASLVVSDLARKLPSIQERKSLRYLWFLLIISIFYLLPVAQLVFGYISLFEHGDEDKCYFNFRCAHPLGRFRAFNNIFSNVGYILMGILFIAIVKYRARTKRKSVGDRSIGSEFDRDLGSSSVFTKSADDLGAPDAAQGLPPNNGVFYTVGYGMVCEGIFSACYHVCPNSENFQFDTSFMYIIAMLLILAIHQRRHADVQSQPQWPYLVVASVISISVIGVYWGKDNQNFYLMLLILYILCASVGSVTLYLIAPWRMSLNCPGEVLRGRKAKGSSRIYEGDDVGAGVASPLIALDSVSPGSPGITSSDKSASSDGVGGVDERERQHFLAVRDQVRFVVMPWLRWIGIGRTLPIRKSRLVQVALINTLNIALLVYSSASEGLDVPSFLLVVLISNVILYLVFYVTMKIIHKEQITWAPVMCLVCALGTWIPALHFFNAGVTSWDHDAAYSRQGNAPCVLWDFYDAHDLWHVLSSFALFFSAMLLLTLDDDLIHVPRPEIKV